jgi:hypothetical protein
LTFPVAITLALAGSLVLLRRHLAELEDVRAVSSLTP